MKALTSLACLAGLAVAASAQTTVTLSGTATLTSSTSFSMSGIATIPGIGTAALSGAGPIEAGVVTGQNNNPILGSFTMIFSDSAILYGSFLFPVGFLVPQAGGVTISTGTLVVKGGTGRFDGAGGTFAPLTGNGQTINQASSTFLISGNGIVIFGQKILPQLAFGGGWYTALYFTNTTSAPVSFPVTFTADDGSPLSINNLGGSTSVANIPPGGSVRLEALNAGPLRQGYAVATLPDGVTGYAVFRQSGGTIADQEAVSPLTAGTSTTASFLFDDTAFTTGVSIVNPSSFPTTVTVTAKNPNGGVIGTGIVQLAGLTKSALSLRNISGLAGVAGNRGAVSFTGTSAVAVLGLRFFGAAFTSIPVTN